jgi:hypothetical protein
MARVNHQDRDATPLEHASAQRLVNEESASQHRLLARRRDERLPTRVAALAHCHGRFQTVRIIDYSLGGLQLRGSFGVTAGDAIIVELLSGHRLAATVAWSMGDRLGIRFVEPLEADHPALAVLQRGRRALEQISGTPTDSQKARNG